MSLMKNIDRYTEFSVQNVRWGIEDLFWVKEKVAEVLMVCSFIWLDIWQKGNGMNWFIEVLRNFFLLQLSTLDWPKEKRNSSWEILELNSKIESYKKFRFLCFICITGLIYHYWHYITFLPLYLYLFKFHDDNYRGIKDWTKWQLKKLKGSIKLPWLKPSPA